MGNRTSQLQIRVTPAEKAVLKRLADAAGETVSAYVLSRVLPSAQLELAGLMGDLARGTGERRRLLEELGEALAALSPSELTEHVPEPEPGTLPPVVLNCIAATIESVAHDRGVSPPDWVVGVPALAEPHFGWPLRSLRPHQIRVAPVAFKRRNIFFDPAAGPLQ